MHRRAFLLSAIAVAAGAACKKRPAEPSMSDAPARSDEPELTAAELVRDRPDGGANTDANVDLSGTLEARSFLHFSGCVPPGHMERWLVLAVGGQHYPIAIVATPALDRARAALADAGPPEPTPPSVLGPDDAPKLGVKLGDRARVRGVLVPLLFSGTVAAMPVYGVLTDKVDRL